LKKTEYCRTIGEIKRVKERWGRPGVHLDIYLVCYECNKVTHESDKRVTIHGNIYGSDCFENYIRVNFVLRDVSIISLNGFLEPLPDVTNLFRFNLAGFLKSLVSK